ncbi:Uncharacterised protein [Vibrio cholerae]|nr:Uncharacterised protein [Vibrio cholerae]
MCFIGFLFRSLGTNTPIVTRRMANPTIDEHSPLIVIEISTIY